MYRVKGTPVITLSNMLKHGEGGMHSIVLWLGLFKWAYAFELHKSFVFVPCPLDGMGWQNNLELGIFLYLSEVGSDITLAENRSVFSLPPTENRSVFFTDM